MSMTKTVTIAPVNKVITVNAPQQRAFDVFTSQMDKWWPRTHHIGAAAYVHSTIEPRVGGRWFVQHEDGSTSVPGIVAASSSTPFCSRSPAYVRQSDAPA